MVDQFHQIGAHGGPLVAAVASDTGMAMVSDVPQIIR